MACRLQTLNYCKIRFTILNLEQQAFFVLLLSIHDGPTCYYALHAIIIFIYQMQIVPQKLIPITYEAWDRTFEGVECDLAKHKHMRCKVTCSLLGADLHRHDGPRPSLTAPHTISLLCSQILQSWHRRNRKIEEFFFLAI